MTTHFSGLPLAVLIFGACLGSFLNVCIHRIPLGKSVVFPGSSCPGCSRAIPFYQNIPVLSFLLLRGKCGFCGQGISLRYPVVEALTAALTLGLFYKFGPTAAFLFTTALTAVLITITFIDLDHQIIPDIISIPGIVVFSASCLVFPNMTFWDTATGILVGGGIPWTLAAAYYLIRGHQGLGGGDIKLLAMIGAATGVAGVLFTLFFGSLSGTAFGLATGAAQRKKSRMRIPFGPFLSFGALLYLFFGDEIIRWYITLLMS